MPKLKRYLWKYMSLDKFESLLENQGLYFSSLTQLRESLDPVEGGIMQLNIENLIAQQLKMKYSSTELGNENINKNIKNILKIKENFYNNTFVSSFNADNIENYALWKIYPSNLKGELQVNQGIAIRINEGFFNKTVENPIFCFDDGSIIDTNRVILRKMDYQPMSKFKELASENILMNNCQDFYKIIHSVKPEYYQYENEKRAVFQFFEKNNNCCKGGFLKINLKEFFNTSEETSIFVSPFASKYMKDYVYFLLNKYELNADELISRSEIITCK